MRNDVAAYLATRASGSDGRCRHRFPVHLQRHRVFWAAWRNGMERIGRQAGRHINSTVIWEPCRRQIAAEMRPFVRKIVNETPNRPETAAFRPAASLYTVVVLVGCAVISARPSAISSPACVLADLTGHRVCALCHHTVMAAPSINRYIAACHFRSLFLTIAAGINPQRI